MAELALGTVQLGMPYGIANTTGVPNQLAVNDIVRTAYEGGVRVFDTAQAYGDSERALGVAFRVLGIASNVRVVSKLRKDVRVDEREAVVGAVQESLARLGVPKLHGLLIHQEDWNEDQLAALRTSLDDDTVERIGVSVYSSERALQAMDVDDVGIVQIPSNMLDRRFERAGVFERARERGVDLYVRSVLLQGLLLTDALPAHLEFARRVVGQVDALARKMGVSRQALALQYVKTAFPDAHIVIGAETAEQVRENVVAWNAPPPKGIVERVREAFRDVEEMVLDPRKWPISQLQHLVTSQKPEKADAIVWLQGNGYDRGAKVLELYRAGYAPRIVVTGNNTRVIENDDVRVVDVVRWLDAHDVCKETIIVDDHAMNTKDQAEYIIALAIREHWKRILLVGSLHHQLRAFLTFLKQIKLQGWEGCIINQTAKLGWDEWIVGKNQTARGAFEEELKKIYTYRDVTSIEDGLQYFEL